MHGETNDTYLHHSYDGTYNASGSIFEDARNGRGFVDPVSILYGHHMASGAMFATLDLWQAVDYFYEHPVMWLLTPTRDYKVELCSAYNTSAYSDTYSFFTAHDFAFAEYLRMVLSSSVIRTGAEADPNANYILMSTCAYVFEDARSVLLGKLVPLASAGGKAVSK
jgi:sortase B